MHTAFKRLEPHMRSCSNNMVWETLHCEKMGNILPNILSNVGQLVNPPIYLLGNVLPNVVGKVMCPPVEQSNYLTFGQDSVHDYPEHG